jgi:hypothetical protein
VELGNRFRCHASLSLWRGNKINDDGSRAFFVVASSTYISVEGPRQKRSTEMDEAGMHPFGGLMGEATRMSNYLIATV